LESIRCAGIEKQMLFPKRKGNYKILVHYGTLIGIFKTLKIPYEEIPPQVWQKAMLGNGKRSRQKSKTLSLKRARALFPKADIGDNHGRSDALLIAEYVRRVRYGKR